MAIYHCSVQVIGRSSGRSSVAASAYRTGECMTNEYDGITHDFTKKNWVEYVQILLPKNAPKEYEDRSTLWNAVEMSEKSCDAQLCREFELALPQELTREEQIEIVNQFAREQLVSQGMVVDIAIHNPPVTNDRHQPVDINGDVTKDKSKMQFINPHAHILATVRPMDEQGKWEKKSEVEYICKKGDEEKAFTATEFKKAKEEGWEKLYKFEDGKKKIWLTASEGKERELKRVTRSPKTSPYGRKNATVEHWNHKDRIYEWRQYWEKVVNDKFSSLNSDIRIDCRSFKDQGREDELPTLHMGASATNMEKRALRELHEGKPESEIEHSDIGNINKQIKEHNKFVLMLKAKLDAIVEKAIDFIGEIARKLESIRAKVIGNYYEETVLFRQHNLMESELVPEGERLERYFIEVGNATKANEESEKTIKELKKELQDCSPIQFAKKTSIQKQIQAQQSEIEIRKDYISSVSRMCGYSSEADYLIAKKKYDERQEDYKKLEETIDSIKVSTDTLSSEYKEEMMKVSPSDVIELEQKRKEIREDMESVTKSELHRRYKDKFDDENLLSAKKKADKILDEKNRKNGLVESKNKKRSHH